MRASANSRPNGDRASPPSVATGIIGSCQLGKVLGHPARQPIGDELAFRVFSTEHQAGVPEVEGSEAQALKAVVERLSLGEDLLHHRDVAAGEDELQLRSARLLLHDLEQGGGQVAVDLHKVRELVDDSQAPLPARAAVEKAEERLQIGQRGALPLLLEHRREARELIPESPGRCDEDVGLAVVGERPE